MGLEAWKKRFYPVSADTFLGKPDNYETQRAAIEHSILKWNGLRHENLIGHGCGFVARAVVDLFNQSKLVKINGDSCALCALNWRELLDDSGTDQCAKCPLFQSRDGVPCDRGAKNQPELYVPGLDDPEVMIDGLQKALAWLNAKEASDGEKELLAGALNSL